MRVASWTWVTAAVVVGRFARASFPKIKSTRTAGPDRDSRFFFALIAFTKPERHVMTLLHWKDRPLAELLRIAWPITVSMLSWSAMTIVDTMLIGHVGRAELAGVGPGGIV